MQTPSDQFEAQLAGVEMAIAVMRGNTPNLSHQWQEVETDRNGYVAFQHPDESVMGCVNRAIRPLDGVALVPGVDTWKAHRGHVVYARKP